MAQHKQSHLDHILFENVSFQVAGLDPVLRSVDLEFPMDQTVIIQSSNPTHAVHLLEILAGRKAPQSGKIKWNTEGAFENIDVGVDFHELLACYFESNRPAPETTVQALLASTEVLKEMQDQCIEHFELQRILPKKFRDLTYEVQKLVMLLMPTLKNPQMLILEDPAIGLSESVFLNYLDWVQLWQRQGHLRHIFLTNNHPTAARHLNASVLHVEDGLIYVEETEVLKKSFNF
jgi:ABC-type multidrug transport system ATPase subunit